MLQSRIDQFFKSTSSNKQLAAKGTVKSGKIKKETIQKKPANHVKNHVQDKHTGSDCSMNDTDFEDVRFFKEIPVPRPTTQSLMSTLSGKKTIKAFAKACNTPPPPKSLKRHKTPSRDVSEESPNKKRPSPSGWKVSASIQTPSRPMTSLSCNWQGTLELSQSSTSQDVVETVTFQDDQNEVASTNTPGVCRALFSSKSTPNSHSTSKIPAKRADQENCSKTSNAPEKIFRSHSAPDLAIETSTKSRSKRSGQKSSKSLFSPRVKLSPSKSRKEPIDTELVLRAVENLNQLKQGIIPENDFDLEKIYLGKSFTFEYGILKAETAIKYEARDVCIPKERNANNLFMALVKVFAEPINCGYFNEAEIHVIFLVLTMSSQAQSLLARMLVRRRGWHRVDSIEYLDIAADLTKVLQELIDRRIFDVDTSNEKLSTLLKLLRVEEIRSLSRSMKINHTGPKPTLIAHLLKRLNQRNSLFVGMKSPSAALMDKLKITLGTCIRLSPEVANILDRVFILLMPNQSPDENIVEALRLLVLVHLDEKIFPPTPKDRFPIFRNRLHLIEYAEARSVWKEILKASEDKDWERVCELGNMAYLRLEPHFCTDSCTESKISSVPSHVKRFEANYAWLKVVSKCIEPLKKYPDCINTAAMYLRSLITQTIIRVNRTRWYSELALIEMHHKKNLESSADVTVEGLSQERLSEIDAADLLDRARKLLDRRKGISSATKERLRAAVDANQQKFLISNSSPKVNEIKATMLRGTGRTGTKSRWICTLSGSLDTEIISTVEQVALIHYKYAEDLHGVHCEGALPVTLFASLFWNEIYNVSAPGAFVSSYQDAPLDLYTSHFLENRRDLIENKLEIVKRLDLDTLSRMIHEDFDKCRHYESIMNRNLFTNSEDFKDFIECLGINGIVGICQRLAENYYQWKSGFPDLALWNRVNKKCKIVEVKGPGDSLSTKQKQWIQYLETLGVNVEVCVIKDTRPN